jgi:hypothetical protein
MLATSEKNASVDSTVVESQDKIDIQKEVPSKGALEHKDDNESLIFLLCKRFHDYEGDWIFNVSSEELLTNL